MSLNNQEIRSTSDIDFDDRKKLSDFLAKIIKSLKEEAEETYKLYDENPNFMKSFSDIMIKSQEIIDKNFPGVSSVIYGRIKVKDSFITKYVQKDGNVFDIYAFRIIVNDVSKKFTSSYLEKLKSKENLSNSDIAVKKITKELDEIDSKIKEAKSQSSINSLQLIRKQKVDELHIAIARIITRELTSSNSELLSSSEAIELSQRAKEYNKPNGYRASQRTLETRPDPNLNHPCFIEMQGHSAKGIIDARMNHGTFKEEKYPEEDFPDFPVEEFNNCQSIDDLNNLCKKVPRYIFIRKMDNGSYESIQAPSALCFFQAYQNYLLESKKDENGKLQYTHPETLKKLLSFWNLQHTTPFPNIKQKDDKTK